MTWFEKRAERLNDEIQAHIDYETQANMEDGMAPEEARRAANMKFGNLLKAREESREIWGWLWTERLWQDIRYALRGFRRNPGFASVALFSLMLGIGASVSLFSVVYGVLISPYPYSKPNEIWAPAVVGPNDPVRGWHRYIKREFLEIQNLLLQLALGLFQVAHHLLVLAHVTQNADGAVVGTFGRPGRNTGDFHSVHVGKFDSRGNFYTGEVDTGKRLQKWVPVE